MSLLEEVTLIKKVEKDLVLIVSYSAKSLF